MSGELNLELLNGNWSIASASLMLICCTYLWHEVSTRSDQTVGHQDRADAGTGVRATFTKGMRVAIAVLTISLGVLIRSVETWRWRVFDGGVSPNDLSQLWLNIGALLAVIGFLCAIREISQPLYGRGPWVWTLVVVVIFNILTIAARFWI